ncbi:amino acid permease [Cupriavidus nantongensis]|uniref:Transporter n=1 Tax=Cupriavidus nantongensis TaxID=1796606 RepID=A0A142JR49_9BURK|nr:amino acid permease [Cupriavidus nantongensis]AMR80561.1 transporter [Cupriavidus nantongensis]
MRQLTISAEEMCVPFTRYDLGWVILCIGMAIGAGVVFLPVQVGIMGVWVFIASVILAYPALYMMQNLYLRTLSESADCDSYVSIITHYLGKNWGFFLSIAYLLMLLKGMLTYSLAVTFDSAKYLQTFGITTQLLSDSPLYSLTILVVLVMIAAQGERLLFKVSGPLVIVKLAIVLLLGFVMIPHWDVMGNLPSFPELKQLAIDTVLTLPFTVFSILFVQILSPMNIAFRKQESDPRIATYRAIRAHRVAYVVLVVSVLFFAISFTFSLSHEQALSAKAQNISALALAGSVIPGADVLLMTTALNVFAIVTAFFGLYLGIDEAVSGIAINVLSRFIPRENINRKVVSIGTSVLIVGALWLWVQSKFSILLLQQIAAPIYGVTSFIIPCLLVYKVPALHAYKTKSVYFVFFVGVVVCMTPVLKALGY